MKSKIILPELNWSQQNETIFTLHLFSQIIGKIRLELMPMQSQWAQVPFTVTSRGLESNAMPCHNGTFDICFDLISHSLNIFQSNGNVNSFQLQGLSVADFYAKVFGILKSQNITVKINPNSVEMADVIRLDKDNTHKTYIPDYADAFRRALILITKIFDKYRSGFCGKQTPVNFFWGSFDLSVTRFSGKPAEPPPGSDIIYKYAMDAGQATVGFWPGDKSVPEAMFFAYTYPKPDGFEKEKLKPNAAFWSDAKAEFFLSYEVVRSSDDPEKTLLEFCDSAYEAGCRLAGWDKKNLERNP